MRTCQRDEGDVAKLPSNSVKQVLQYDINVIELTGKTWDTETSCAIQSHAQDVNG